MESIMKHVIIWIISIVLFFINIYLYIWDPLGKYFDLIKIVLVWTIVLCILNYLFRRSKRCVGVGYIKATALLALAYFVIPM